MPLESQNPEARDATLLDNPAWHALRGPLSRFAVSEPGGHALRFDPEVAFFCAVDRLDEKAWSDQAALVGPEGVSVLFRDEVPGFPAGWNETFRGVGFQMVATELATAREVSPERLGPGDVEEMLALVALTDPGPFFVRTIELGTYVGIRQGGRLVAMAGERMRVPGWVEISAICTHPDAQRGGLGAALTLWMAQHIRQGGDEAFLHVLDDNEKALRLYRSLGFEVRRKVDVVAAQWVGDV